MTLGQAPSVVQILLIKYELRQIIHCWLDSCVNLRTALVYCSIHYRFTDLCSMFSAQSQEYKVLYIIIIKWSTLDRDHYQDALRHQILRRLALCRWAVPHPLSHWLKSLFAWSHVFCTQQQWYLAALRKLLLIAPSLLCLLRDRRQRLVLTLRFQLWQLRGLAWDLLLALTLHRGGE